jgi:hypothetical protein
MQQDLDFNIAKGKVYSKFKMTISVHKHKTFYFSVFDNALFFCNCEDQFIAYNIRCYFNPAKPRPLCELEVLSSLVL